MRFGWVVLLAACAASGCKGGRTRDAVMKQEFGAIAHVDGLDAAPYLAMARAIIRKESRPEPAPAPRPGQRVFVTVYTSHDTFAATGLSDTLMNSVIAASEEASRRAGTVNENARVKLDIVTDAEDTEFEKEIRVRPAEAGTFGYAFGEAAQFGFVLPTEIVTSRDLDISKMEDGTVRAFRPKIAEKLAARAGVSTSVLENMSRRFRIKTAAWVDSQPPGRALPVTRAMLQRPPALSPDDLLAAVRSGADYLARMTGDNGRFTYMYRPIEDEADKGYGMLRHAGAVYALMEAYSEFGTAKYLERAELAIGYLKSRFQATPDGSYVADNPDEEQQKVGGCGLALVALAKHAAATGKKDELETMRGLARFIVHQQYPDGHFRNNADVSREDERYRGKKLKVEVSYFPGEAILGLLRLYAVDPQAQWLDAAKKGAAYLIFTRDVHETEKTQIQDHWLSYAMNDLYRQAKDEAYPKHAFKIARAIFGSMKTAQTAPAPDYVSTFYDFAETTPASTRLEALAADMELSRYMGQPIDWLSGPATEIARYMRSQQLDENSAFYLRHPEKAIGGVRESVANSDIRIDYVQHAMCSWLHFARLLRDPAYGTH